MNELALFAGAGGGILSGRELGWRTICAVERDAYAAAVLAQRQNDGFIDIFPIWSDVQTFDGKPWTGIVDVVSGGFPCQDISTAGKGAGIDGERSGMWREMARIICEVRPRFVFVENSPALTTRGLGRVLGDLAALGYDAEWGVLSAESVGAPHRRDRIWIVAHAKKLHGYGCEDVAKSGRPSSQEFRSRCSEDVLPNPTSIRQQGQRGAIKQCDKEQDKQRKTNFPFTDYGWRFEPDVGRVADGVAFRMDRLKAIGNGQVPQCAAEAFRQLEKRARDANG